MRLAIFGATGRTGQLVLKQALKQGHQVTALVRDPIKLDFGHERLKVIKGEITVVDDVNTAIVNCQAVVSVLGPTSNKPEYNVSRGMEHIIEAMRKHGVRRLVVSSGAAIRDAEDDPGWIDAAFGYLVRIFSRHVYRDMVRTVEAVRSSGLDWTVVRVPMLTDDAPTGEVKVSYLGKGMGLRLSRDDLAAFILQQVRDDTYLHLAPAISS